MSKMNADESWTYRGIECRLYIIDESVPTRYVAYCRIGDQWHEVCDTELSVSDVTTVIEQIESTIDSELSVLFEDDDDDNGWTKPPEYDANQTNIDITPTPNITGYRKYTDGNGFSYLTQRQKGLLSEVPPYVCGYRKS